MTEILVAALGGFGVGLCVLILVYDIRREREVKRARVICRMYGLMGRDV